MSLEFESPIIALQERIKELEKLNKDPGVQFDSEIAELNAKLQAERQNVYANLTPWQSVQVARHKDRPLFQDYVDRLLEDYIELHGDRHYGDDHALLGGFATMDGHQFMLIGFDKGKELDDKMRNNFGMAHPEGYRKALRLMKLAEKYRLPVVCFVDTPAAYPGAEAEARGQAEAIARNITEMAAIETPIIVIILGEGGSGGALGIGVGDIVLMLSNSIYSVIPPEGCAAILWRDSSMAEQAADALKLTSKSLLDLGVIDGIIDEPAGGAHSDPDATAKAVRKALLKHLVKIKRVSIKKLMTKRYQKYENMGA